MKARASSSVSLRDILRVLKLFKFFSTDTSTNVFSCVKTSPEDRFRNSMLLSLAVVYYLRLGVDSSVDGDFRKKFRNRLKGACGQKNATVEETLTLCMDALMAQTELEPGIAKTRGLQENIFMVVVCCLAQVPLMIVGPPGSAKTLAVTIVDENARGEFSKSEFYRSAPALIPFRYQCRSPSSFVSSSYFLLSPSLFKHPINWGIIHNLHSSFSVDKVPATKSRLFSNAP